MGLPLNDATDNLLAERGKTHGHIEDNAYFTEMLVNIAKAKAPKAGVLVWDLMGPTPRLCLGMILHKIGRILSGQWNFADHWRDIAGYATLIADRLERGELH